MDYPALRAGVEGKFDGFQRNLTVSGVKLLEVNRICKKGVIIRLGNGNGSILPETPCTALEGWR